MIEYREQSLPGRVARLVEGGGVHGGYLFYDPEAPSEAPSRKNSVFMLHAGPAEPTGKKALLFFPGPPGNHHTLLYFARLGALRGHDVYVPDLSGLGLSARRSGVAATFDNYAAVDIPAIIELLSQIHGGGVMTGGVCGGAGGALMSLSYLARRSLDGDAGAAGTLDKIDGLVTLSMPFDFSQEGLFQIAYDAVKLFSPHTKNKYFFKWVGHVEQLLASKHGDPGLYKYVKNKNLNGYSDVPASIIEVYGEYFKTGRLSIRGIDCTRQIGAVASQWGKPVLSISGRGDELYTYNALRGFPRKLDEHAYPDYIYIVIDKLGHLPLLGSKCEKLWDRVLAPWLDARPRGETSLDKLLRVPHGALALHSDIYR